MVSKYIFDSQYKLQSISAQMSELRQFPFLAFCEVLSDTSQIEKKLKPFIKEFKRQNMQWIYQAIATFHKILNNKKQLPIVKFNTLLALKHCFDTCEYALVTLIQVYILPKVAEVASFRAKVKDESLLTTYFSTEGYREKDHKDLAKISFNYVMLAIELIFMAAQVKRSRNVEQFELRQGSKFLMVSQLLLQKGIKPPEKYSFFLPEYQKEQRKKYLDKLKEFSEQKCEFYSEYFLSLIIGEMQTGKRGELEVKNLFSFGECYLTSAMINLCEEELNAVTDKCEIEGKKKYLNLFNEFVRWGDIEAVLMVHNSDFVTKIGSRVASVRGDISTSQGQNILPEIPGKKQEKKQFYVDFLRCIETWAECMPFNEDNLQSNVKKLYCYLKEDKKFRFPENMIIKPYKKELEENLKKNQERNQRLVKIINEFESEDNQSVKRSIRHEKIFKTRKADDEPLPVEILSDRIEEVKEALESLTEKQSEMSAKYAVLRKFKENWMGYLDSFDVDDRQINEEEEALIEEVIVDGDECMEAIQMIFPLLEEYHTKKITFLEFNRKFTQTLEVRENLSVSQSRNSLKKSVRVQNSLSKSVQKGNNKNSMIQSMFRSRRNNSNTSRQSNLQMSQQSSVMRKSRMTQKLQKIKESSSHFNNVIESHASNIDKLQADLSSLIREKNIQKRPFKHMEATDHEPERFRHQEIIKQEEKSEYTQSFKSKVSRQKDSRLSSAKKESMQLKASLKKSGIEENTQSRVELKSPRSKHNITIVSRSSMENLEVLEEDSKRLIAEMEISKRDKNEKIVVEYSDIDEREIQEKVQERERRHHQRDKINRKLELKHSRQNQLSDKQRKSQENSEQMIGFEQNSSRPREKTKEISEHNLKEKYNNRLMPFNEDYGGKSKNTGTRNLDQDLTPKRSLRLKASNSKISLRDESRELMNSSRSSARADFRKSSGRKSLIKQSSRIRPDRSERSLESQIREMKETQIRQKSRDSSRVSGVSRSKSFKKVGLQITTQSKIKQLPSPQEEYKYVPITHKKQADLSKTKKISEKQVNVENNLQDSQKNIQNQSSRDRQNNLMHRVFEQKMSNNQRQGTKSGSLIPKTEHHHSLDSKIRKGGISVSLGKNSSKIGKSVLKVEKTNEAEGKVKNDQRQQYYIKSGNIRRNREVEQDKLSAREKIKRRLNSQKNLSDSDSSIGDLICSPNAKPLLNSRHEDQKISTKPQLNKKLNEIRNFKEQLAKDMQNSDEYLPSFHNLNERINYGAKKNDVIIKVNPHNAKANKIEETDSNFVSGKRKQRQLARLQEKVKNLESESRAIKTKLAVKEQEVKSYKASSMGSVQFTSPSISNFNASERTSNLGSEKLLSRHPSEFNSQRGDSPLLYGKKMDSKIIDSEKYRLFFSELKGNTFKKTLLKSKCLMDKHEEIEIGCLSVKKGDFSIEVTVFITPLRFDLVDFHYQISHDQNIEIKCNPDRVKGIELKRQQKINIKMAVKNCPFVPLTMNLSYRSKTGYSSGNLSLTLPILFNKFCHFDSEALELDEEKLITIAQLLSTSEFKINHKVLKQEKMKDILPFFVCQQQTKQIQTYVTKCQFKDTSFILILKMNEKGSGILEALDLNSGDKGVIEFILITLKSIISH